MKNFGSWNRRDIITKPITWLAASRLFGGFDFLFGQTAPKAESGSSAPIIHRTLGKTGELVINAAIKLLAGATVEAPHPHRRRQRRKPPASTGTVRRPFRACPTNTGVPSVFPEAESTVRARRCERSCGRHPRTIRDATPRSAHRKSPDNAVRADVSSINRR